VLSVNIDKSIFRAYDIRGVCGSSLTPEIMERIGIVIGRQNPGKKFVVGNDIRKSGEELKDALIEGLLCEGADIVYAGTASFGETLFAGWKMERDITLYITASHLPPEWNGLKLYYSNGEPFSEMQIKEIGDMAEKVSKIHRSAGKFRRADIRNEYIDFITERFSMLKGSNLKVVLDCGNGSMCLVAPVILKRLGFDVVELYCSVDSDFPNRESEPTPGSTKSLCKRVVEESADFGIAFDGDGDRCAIVDNKGNFLDGSLTGVLIGKHMNIKGKNVIASISCSRNVEEELHPMGANVIRVPVGHTHLISACKKYQAVFGMEESGHIVMPEYFLFDDAILIPLKVAEILMKSRKSLSDIAGRIKVYASGKSEFYCNDNAKFAVIEELEQFFKGKYSIDKTDGIRLELENSRVIIRASNTSPKIRMHIESDTHENVQKLNQKFSEILKQIISHKS